ncbi:MAG: signal peptidase I [Actinomycetaceae bacterium]|nr:signal peptidase I [Actinomycetaceae bacterium]
MIRKRIKDTPRQKPGGFEVRGASGPRSSIAQETREYGGKPDLSLSSLTSGLAQNRLPPQLSKAEEAKRKKSRAWVREMVFVMITALAISALVRAVLIQTFYIPSASMENTLMVDDAILVTKMAPKLSPLNRGDTVVFKDRENWLGEDPGAKKPQGFAATGLGAKIAEAMVFLGLRPETSDSHLVKRVIGTGGDRVRCCTVDGRLEINGKAVDEMYLHPSATRASVVDFDVTVPPDHLWVLGDNRNNSGDSRSHMADPSEGFIPLDDVVGRAFLAVWPLDRVGMLSNSCAFYGVPDPVAKTETPAQPSAKK